MSYCVIKPDIMLVMLWYSITYYITSYHSIAYYILLYCIVVTIIKCYVILHYYCYNF